MLTQGDRHLAGGRSLDVHRLGTGTRLGPGVPPLRLVVVDAKCYCGQGAVLPVQPPGLQTQADPPAAGRVARSDGPAAARTLRPQSPIRISPWRLPASVTPPVHHAAVQHPPEIPLKLLVAGASPSPPPVLRLMTKSSLQSTVLSGRAA